MNVRLLCETDVRVTLANPVKNAFLDELSSRYGRLTKLSDSLSLFDIGRGAARIYIRYSKLHKDRRTFFGLRREDLRQLEGHTGIICFLWQGQSEPLFIPFAEYEGVFDSVSPARDGQYKTQVFMREETTDLYVANAGRFNVDAHFGWERLDAVVDRSRLAHVPQLSHAQVQTLLGAIGTIKGYEIWIPSSDKSALDWSLVKKFECAPKIPCQVRQIENVFSEIDVVWIERGVGNVRAAFEVEYSTPIYSGLLRFNDLHLMCPRTNATYSIVSGADRRELFLRQLTRPTFTASHLAERCTFIEYPDVFAWHARLARNQEQQL